MRYDAEHREKTHESLVDAAGCAFVRRDGPEKISVAELMKSVGLTHGGFYYHFSSREDMIARAIERAFSSTVARLETIAAEGDTRRGDSRVRWNAICRRRIAITAALAARCPRSPRRLRNWATMRGRHSSRARQG